MEPIIAGLFLAPIKSMGMLRVQSLGIDDRGRILDPTGTVMDRQGMVVDSDGAMITQRECPELARVRPFIAPKLEGGTKHGVGLRYAGAHDLFLPKDSWETGKRRQVRVWDDTVAAVDQGREAQAWISNILGRNAQLVMMPEDTVRKTPRTEEKDVLSTTFADSYPLLMISQESLDELNEVLAKAGSGPVKMDSFRPSVVVQGCKAFGEDLWIKCAINGGLFRAVKPCARCVMVEIDQISGQRRKEGVLAALKSFREDAKWGKPDKKKVIFGMNYVAHTEGRINVGDAIKVIHSGPRPSL